MCAENMGLGMGIGLVASSLVTKAIFTPLIIYAVRAIWLISILVKYWFKNETSSAWLRRNDG